MNRQDRIQHSLTTALTPTHLEVINESSGHNVPANSETHFKIIIVSNNFAEQSKVQRHQSIYQLLQTELTSGLHALSLHPYTPNEWASKSTAVADSPHCRGGDAIG